jgi:alpha-L-fucosidase
MVHWGLSGLAGTWEGKPVATRGGMEWIQQRVKADTEPTPRAPSPCSSPKARLRPRVGPLAKDAGCRYVVFTTKHHDGFALHDSKVSALRRRLRAAPRPRARRSSTRSAPKGCASASTTR